MYFLMEQELDQKWPMVSSVTVQKNVAETNAGTNRNSRFLAPKWQYETPITLEEETTSQVTGDTKRQKLLFTLSQQ